MLSGIVRKSSYTSILKFMALGLQFVCISVQLAPAFLHLIALWVLWIALEQVIRYHLFASEATRPIVHLLIEIYFSQKVWPLAVAKQGTNLLVPD